MRKLERHWYRSSHDWVTFPLYLVLDIWLLVKLRRSYRQTQKSFTFLARHCSW